MASNLQFLQKHCLILKLVLFHGSKSGSNELLWCHHITSELSKLCKVLYARPTLSRLHTTFTRQNTGIDLVLSSHDVGLLSPVLFGITGITMNNRNAQVKTSDLVCPRIDDYFKLEESNGTLESLRTRLTGQWNRRRHASVLDRDGQQEMIKLGPWLFNATPVKQAVTSENNLVALNMRNLTKAQYNVKGSRFFQEENLSKDSSLTRSDEESSNSFLRIRPILYENIDSMPDSLERWLHDVLTEDAEPDAADQDRLDLLLHGFKGFN